MACRFHLRARAVIIDNDHILLCSSGNKDILFLPGGHVEKNETVSYALKRELQEELGKNFEISKYLGLIEYKYQKNNENHFEINHIFLVNNNEISSKSLSKSLEPKVSFKWIKISDLQNYNVQPSSIINLIQNFSKGDDSIWWVPSK